jgi:anti-anti-sigma regulatory factor
MGMTAESLNISFQVAARTTVMIVRGNLDASRCRELRAGLDRACRIRERGPIVVDLRGAGRVGSAAMLCLVRAVREAELAGRDLAVQL